MNLTPIYEPLDAEMFEQSMMSFATPGGSLEEAVATFDRIVEARISRGTIGVLGVSILAFSVASSADSSRLSSKNPSLTIQTSTLFQSLTPTLSFASGTEVSACSDSSASTCSINTSARPSTFRLIGSSGPQKRTSPESSLGQALFTRWRWLPGWIAVI